MKIRNILTIVVVLFSSACLAQDSEQQLYYAYLDAEMDIWARHIDSTDWNSLPIAEQTVLLNYEYGYAAHAIGAKLEDAAYRLEQFAKHLEAHRAHLDSGIYYCYKTGVCSFRLSFERRQIAKQIKGIYENIKRAMAISPNDPFVLTMQGNVEFFNPIFGSKQKALMYYQKADSIYNTHADQYNYPRWNIRAMQMPLLQSMGYVRSKEEVLQKCNEILTQEPKFSYITGTFLPAYLKEKEKEKEKKK